MQHGPQVPHRADCDISGKAREVVGILEAIHALEDQTTAQTNAADVVEMLHDLKLSKDARVIEEGVAETLSDMFDFGTCFRRVRVKSRFYSPDFRGALRLLSAERSSDPAATDVLALSRNSKRLLGSGRGAGLSGTEIVLLAFSPQPIGRIARAMRSTHFSKPLRRVRQGRMLC
jgi:hypothetical protein